MHLARDEGGEHRAARDAGVGVEEVEAAASGPNVGHMAKHVRRAPEYVREEEDHLCGCSYRDYVLWYRRNIRRVGPPVQT